MTKNMNLRTLRTLRTLLWPAAAGLLLLALACSSPQPAAVSSLGGVQLQHRLDRPPRSLEVHGGAAAQGVAPGLGQHRGRPAVEALDPREIDGRRGGDADHTLELRPQVPRLLEGQPTLDPDPIPRRTAMRGGVPVFRRSTANGNSRSRVASRFAGGSPARPPE